MASHCQRDRQDIRKILLPVRLVRHWNGISREAVAASCLKVFQARLDRAWSNVG